MRQPSQAKHSEDSNFKHISKRYSLRIALLFFTFIVGTVALPFLHHLLAKSSFFNLQTIIIWPSSKRVTQQEMQLYLSAYLGQYLYGIDMDEVEEKAKQHPWIKTVSLRRFPPHELHVHFQEHQPVAFISFQQIYVVNADGQLFKLSQKSDALELPIITGVNQNDFFKNKNLFKQQIESAIEALHEHSATNSPGGKISELHVSKTSRVTVHFQNGLKVILGKNNYQKKWLKLMQIISILHKKEANLEYAYLDDYPNTDQVAVRFKKASS